MPDEPHVKPIDSPGGLSLRPGTRVWVGGHDIETKRRLQRYLAGTVRPASGPIDVALITPQTADEARYFVAKVAVRLAPHGAIWVVTRESTLLDPTKPDFPLGKMMSTIERDQFRQDAQVQLDDACWAVRFRPITY